ncbi:hypothetical protein Hanom_Chr06g00578851 [Helianthus anomalus]
MMNPNFGKHSVVLDFRLPQGRTIVRYDNQLACSFHPTKTISSYNLQWHNIILKVLISIW